MSNELVALGSDQESLCFSLPLRGEQAGVLRLFYLYRLVLREVQGLPRGTSLSWQGSD